MSLTVTIKKLQHYQSQTLGCPGLHFSWLYPKNEPRVVNIFLHKSQFIVLAKLNCMYLFELRKLIGIPILPEMKYITSKIHPELN
jgi:hypothetical protein